MSRLDQHLSSTSSPPYVDTPVIICYILLYFSIVWLALNTTYILITELLNKYMLTTFVILFLSI